MHSGALDEVDWLESRLEHLEATMLSHSAGGEIQVQLPRGAAGSNSSESLHAKVLPETRGLTSAPLDETPDLHEMLPVQSGAFASPKT